MLDTLRLTHMAGCLRQSDPAHYSDVIMGVMASHITGASIVYSTVCSGADHRKHQSSASLTFVRGKFHLWLVNSPHKGPVTWKMFPFDDVVTTLHEHCELDHYCMARVMNGISLFRFQAVTYLLSELDKLTFKYEQNYLLITLPEPMLLYCQLDHGNIFWWNHIQNW